MQLTAFPGLSSWSMPQVAVAFTPKGMKEHFKRVIFVFSVLATLDRSRYANERTINEINGRLRLAKAQKLCLASVGMHVSIWKHLGKDGASIYNDLPLMTAASARLERELLCKYYTRHCPDWLRYGTADGRDMIRDLHRLFNALTTRSL